MKNTMYYLLSQINAELLALSPQVGEVGKMVIWRGKRYFLSRQYRTDMVWVRRIKGERSFDNAR